jgi:MFS family permease
MEFAHTQGRACHLRGGRRSLSGREQHPDHRDHDEDPGRRSRHASAAYSFVRFTGGAVAPWLAGVLGDYAVQLPFWVGAIAVAGAIGVLASARSLLGVIDDQPGHGAEPLNSLTEAQAVSLGDS